MEAIRTIQQAIDGEIHLHLPRAFWGQQVEVIVLTTGTPEGQPAKRAKNSLRGALKSYANPSLIPLEEGAWVADVSDPHQGSSS